MLTLTACDVAVGPLPPPLAAVVGVEREGTVHPAADRDVYCPVGTDGDVTDVGPEDREVRALRPARDGVDLDEVRRAVLRRLEAQIEPVAVRVERHGVDQAGDVRVEGRIDGARGLVEQSGAVPLDAVDLAELSHDIELVAGEQEVLDGVGRGGRERLVHGAREGVHLGQALLRHAVDGGERPPIQTEAPSEMTAYTVPLVLATKPGRSSPVERATAIMLSRNSNRLPLVARG